MQITEPVTMLTDYALGAFGLYFAMMLSRSIGNKNRTCGRFWSTGFAAHAVAAFAGGTYHGFTSMLIPSTLVSLWNVTVLSIGAGSAFMIAGVMTASVKKQDESRGKLVAGLCVTLAGFAIQQSGFRHGAHFNHNDAFHLIQIAAFYLFFRGARLLQDRIN